MSIEQFCAELRAFEARKEVLNALRRDLRKPMPQFRKEVRANARGVLPSTGGLNEWVASARMNIRFKDTGRSAGVRIKVARKSQRDKSDLDAIDRVGIVRHPLYGNRAYWFPTSVPSGYFTDVFQNFGWLELADESFDRALDKIRGG